MTDQPTQDAIVSQRDREVAADYWCSSDHPGKRRMLEGCADNSDLLKMLATYRAEIEAATVERCAEVASSNYQHGYERMLDTIRKLKVQTS